MSRSRRKTPIFGFTLSESEAKDKSLWHRRWRRKERATLTAATPRELEEHVSSDKREVSNVWDMAKDGRQWVSKRAMERIANFSAQRKGKRMNLSAQEVEQLKVRELRRTISK